MLHRQHRHTRRRHLSITNILTTIPLLFATSAHAIPTFTAAADIHDAASTPTQIPPPTPATTSTYTVTKISSTTLTTSSPVLHISPHILSLITTMTVTTYEPWPAFTFPSDQNDVGSPNRNWSTTVLEEVVSSVTWVERRRYLDVDMGDVGGTGRIIGEEEGEKKKKKGRGEEKNEEEEERGKEEETTVTSFVVATENTWVVHPAGPTGIFLATGVGAVGCGGCSLAPAQPTGSGSRLGRAETEEPSRRWEQKTAQEQEKVTRDKPKRQPRADMTWTEAEEVTVVEDPICRSTNLTTGCQGQCIWKPAAVYNLQAINNPSTHPEAHPATATATTKGTYWCLHIHPYHYADPSLRMGRACWGPYLRYRQLNVPCLVGDVGMACLPCVKGGEGEPGKKDESWDAVFWEGEE